MARMFLVGYLGAFFFPVSLKGGVCDAPRIDGVARTWRIFGFCADGAGTRNQAVRILPVL